MTETEILQHNIKQYEIIDRMQQETIKKQQTIINELVAVIEQSKVDILRMQQLA